MMNLVTSVRAISVPCGLFIKTHRVSEILLDLAKPDGLRLPFPLLLLAAFCRPLNSLLTVFSRSLI